MALVLVGVALLMATACQPYAYLHLDSRGQPVRWSPCATIHYQIDPTGGRLVLTSDIHDAFAAASLATGIPVRYDGRVDADGVHQDDRDPVWVSYGVIPGRHAGWSDPAIRGGRYVSGVIVLDPGDLNGDAAARRRVAFHEVGHLFGLDHPDGEAFSTQVMGIADAPYRSGDLDGLRALGRSPKGCPAR